MHLSPATASSDGAVRTSNAPFMRSETRGMRFSAARLGLLPARIAGTVSFHSGMAAHLQFITGRPSRGHRASRGKSIALVRRARALALFDRWLPRWSRRYRLSLLTEYDSTSPMLRSKRPNQALERTAGRRDAHI